MVESVHESWSGRQEWPIIEVRVMADAWIRPGLVMHG